MLALTQHAVEAINQLAPGDAGLRVFLAETGDDDRSLQLQVAETPAADDHVLESDGARVFLESEAAVALDEMVLDATAETGSVRFALRHQD